MNLNQIVLMWVPWLPTCQDGLLFIYIFMQFDVSHQLYNCCHVYSEFEFVSVKSIIFKS